MKGPGAPCGSCYKGTNPILQGRALQGPHLQRPLQLGIRLHHGNLGEAQTRSLPHPIKWYAEFNRKEHQRSIQTAKC